MIKKLTCALSIFTLFAFGIMGAIHSATTHENFTLWFICNVFAVAVAVTNLIIHCFNK